MPYSRVRRYSVLVAALVLGGRVAMPASRLEGRFARRSPSVTFFDAPSQAAEFIGLLALDSAHARADAGPKEGASGYSRSLPQGVLDRDVLLTVQLAKTAWGLSNHLIVRKGAGQAEVRNRVSEWLAFVNPNGFSGSACDTAGGCSRRFAHDGCGGMDERNLLTAR